jgi:hypothetical protein
MTLAGNLRENRAVYAMAGAGDLAVQKLREVPEQMTRYQGEVRETVDRYRVQVRHTVDRYRGEVARYQERVDARELPGAAVAYATYVGTRAVGFIDELAERGKRVVNREAADITIAAPKPEAKPRSAQPKKSTRSRSTRKNGA